MDYYQGQSEKGMTDWAYRDGRNGYIDANTSKAVKKMFENHHPNGINFNKYFEIPIEISEDDIPQLMNFTDCEVHPALLQNLKKFGYSKPTPVQQYAIPVSLLRRDLMACAQTGSGKTAAYLYPLIAKMLQDGPPPNFSQRSARPVSLILAPTRELTVQIYEETLKFTYLTGMRVVVVYGGASMTEQERKLLDGADIIIATPGRLIDFIERGVINLYIVRYLILDEADRMLDMGFEPQLIKVLTAIKKVDRETIMCSATFPRQIQEIAMKYLKNFVKLSVGRVGSTTENITQKLMLVRSREKEDFLVSLLMELKGQILIFVERKSTANDISAFLLRQGVRCTSIHGDRSQPDRERALNDFKNQSINILIATDVASRGLDIPNVAYVIIYDLPNNIESYVHRIGRTGRIGNTGIALTLVEDKQVPVLNNLMEVLKECHQNIPEWFNALNRGDHLLPEWYAEPSVKNISRPREDSDYNQGNNFNPRGQGYNPGRGYNNPDHNYSSGYNRGQGYDSSSYNQRGGRGRGNSDFRGGSQYEGRGNYNYGEKRNEYNPRNDEYRPKNFDQGRGSSVYSGEGDHGYGGNEHYQHDGRRYNEFNARGSGEADDRGRGRGRGRGGEGYDQFNRGGYRGGYGASSGGYGRGYGDSGNYSHGYERPQENTGFKQYENESWGGSSRNNPSSNEKYGDWSSNQQMGNERRGYPDRGRGRGSGGYNSEPRENYGRGYRGRGNEGYNQRDNYGDYASSGRGRGRGDYSRNYSGDHKPQRDDDHWGGDSNPVVNNEHSEDPWGGPSYKSSENNASDPWAEVASENKESIRSQPVPSFSSHQEVKPTEVIEDDPWA